MNAVECTDLVKTFGKIRAIDGLTIQIAENRITGLVGRNGAGKTTFLKLAAGLLRPTGGNISVFGKKPFNSLEVSQNLIFIDDNMHFPPSLSVGEIISEMPRFYRDFDTDLAKRLIEYFSIDKSRHAANLSKGLRSTFNAIVGVAARVPLTIFDEPTTGMDEAVRKDFYRVLLKEYIDFPRTVIISSHYLGELSKLLEDIVLIDSGRLVKAMTADEAVTYAVGLRGDMKAVEKLSSGREVLHKEAFAAGVFLVVKGTLTPEDSARARDLGVEVLPVAANDLCIYLTERDKGGIVNALRRE